VQIPWAQRVWALPLLTCLAPSERFYAHRKRPSKTLLDWARQQCFPLRRWLPDRDLTLVVDGAFAALDFLAHLRSVSITCITRLRLDARLYAPPPRRPGHPGRPSLKGERLPSLKTRLTDRTTRWQYGDRPQLVRQGRTPYSVLFRNCPLVSWRSASSTPTLGFDP
jgi:hypothetical protein